MPFKIVFAGTSEFAVPSLEILLKSQNSICAVYTRPNRPAGRGLKLTQSPIKQFAMRHRLPIYQPENLRNENEQSILKDLQADIMIDAAYGLFLPKEVLEIFKFGCINVHPSLLPRWRGAAPIQRAILAGDKKTGVTIMQVDEGWDTGDILSQVTCNIEKTDTSASLDRKLANIGAELLLDTLQKVEIGRIQPVFQDNNLSCYAKKITKQEARLDWKLSAEELNRAVRAYNPWPVAFTSIDDQVLRIWKSEVINEITHEQPGTIIRANKNGVDVAAGTRVLRLLELQFPGGKILQVGAILNSKSEMFQSGRCLHG